MRIILEKNDGKWPGFDEERLVKVIFDDMKEASLVMKEMQKCCSIALYKDDKEFNGLLLYMRKHLTEKDESQDNKPSIVLCSGCMAVVAMCMVTLVLGTNLFERREAKCLQRLNHLLDENIDLKTKLSKIRELVEKVEEHQPNEKDLFPGGYCKDSDKQR